MKILFLSDDFLPDSDVVGGAGIVAFRLANKFSLLGHEVSAITATRHATKSGRSELGGMSVYRLYSKYSSDRWRSYRSMYNASLVKELDRVLSEIKPDIVFAHTIHLYLCLLYTSDAADE